jgi:DNA-binding IclR family transcriptional regulator
MSLKNRILACLEKSEMDLSIHEIAEKTGIHRDTVAKWVEVLLAEKRIRESRKVGKARFFIATERKK